MATIAEIDEIIKGMNKLKYLLTQKKYITKTGNTFKVTMPITGKEIDISIPQEDINEIDSSIVSKKTQLKNMWKAIEW